MQKYKVYINNSIKIITDNWEEFCADYSIIEAAGGVVYNNEDQVLMIFRNGKWDLPKGKLEMTENIKECAIREVEEECGVNDLRIISEMLSTYHTYKLNGQSILKRVFWFKMYTQYNKELVPQSNEGITKVEWVNKEDIPNRLKNAYANIKELL
ncbi:MAG: NUDIX hydrolase [Flavobacteriales bacterium]|nr:NUDIX hydrolase [Flavobacteriales bacterium]|tara:strand:- start:3147 stop:3608 length:462 start_codon:yes stop_codon:yes gene_type:complete